MKIGYVFWLRTFAVASITLVPIFSMLFGVYVVRMPGVDVNRDTCNCTCWDAIHRNPLTNDISYRHIYVNATWNTLFIWVLILAIILIHYEGLQMISNSILSNQSSNHQCSILPLYYMSFGPHYVGWWNILMYLNEEQYSYIYGQAILSTFDMISTKLMLRFADESLPDEDRYNTAGWISAVSAVRAWTQLCVGYFDDVQGENKIWRFLTVALIILTDLYHFIVPFWFLLKSYLLTQQTKPSNIRNIFAFIWISCVFVYVSILYVLAVYM